MSGFGHGELPKRPVPGPDRSPETTSGSITLGGRNDHGESTVPEPVAPFAGIPTVPLPPGRPRRRPGFLVGMPALALGTLAVLAVVAGLLFIPPLTPWSRSPVESPLDGAEPGVGVFGTGTPGTPGEPGPGATRGGGADPGATDGPTVTGSAGASVEPGATPPATGSAGTTTTATVPAPRITGFATRQLVGGLLGYQIDLSVTNNASVAQNWSNASAYINGVPLGVTWEPKTGLRAFLASGRVCVEPTDTATRTLDPDESQPITLTLTMVSLGQAPRQGVINDGQCPASAES